MSSPFKMWYKTPLLLLLMISRLWGIRLPKYVDQKLSNQINEEIKDEIIPLQNVACFQELDVNCFRFGNHVKTNDWSKAEFQVNSHLASRKHHYKLTAYSSDREILFESGSMQPDQDQDIIIDISLVKRENSGDVYFMLSCTDCYNKVVNRSLRGAVAFVILKEKTTNKRIKRSTVRQNDCLNDGDVERCCVNKKYVSKSLIFENATSIIAPRSIPVTYCAGSCYLDMYNGNHNYALLKYYQSLVGQKKTKLLKHLPCCNAKEFRDMAILYRMSDGSHMMRYSRNLIVDSCNCQ